MSLEVSIQKKLGDFFLDVDLSLSGRHLGILGASGCGKSMTMKSIAGIETPDAGRVTANGRILFDASKRINLRPQARGIGYLFQSCALFPHMTAFENVACGLRLPKRERQEQTWEMLARFRIEDLADLYPHELSGGQRQRAALARMLIARPAAVLLDEPFSALDTHLREQMQLELAQLLRGRENVILVTHSRDEAYRLCPELLIMEKGHVIAAGSTKQLFENPVTVQTARLTGCKNIVPARPIGDYAVEVPGWGVTLRSARPVGVDITHVGVRAHDFIPADSPGGFTCNLIRLRAVSATDEPFERCVLFQNADAPKTGKTLWWKAPKSPASGLPEFLHVPPHCVLLLREVQ